MTPVAAGLGYQLDATQLSTLFQDSGGTTPVTAGGQSVGMWKVAPANATNFVQATAVNQPTYQTNVINGKPAVRFDGSNDQLLFSATANPQNVFVVNRPGTPQTVGAGIGE